MNKTLLPIFSAVFFLGLAGRLEAETHISHDFNNTKLPPYETRKADQRTRVIIKNKAVETQWKQSLYNGTNSGRKAQFMPIGDPHFKKHIWMGLSIKIHSDYMKDNPNTHAGLMQIWGYKKGGTGGNHMCMLKFDGRKGGALVWQHRYGSVKKKTHHLIYPEFPRNKFVDIVIHVELAEKGKGNVQIWVDSVLKVNESNQTIGWGVMDKNGFANGGFAAGTSIGQYNYMENASLDDAYDGKNIQFDGHKKGETRTVTYDNVSLYDGVDGYDKVDPHKNGRR